MARAEYEVQGLRELQRDLKRRGDGAQKELRVIFNRSAGVGVRRIKQYASRTPQATEAASRTRVRSQQKRIVIVAGGARQPWIFGAEFGSNRYPQFPAPHQKGPGSGRWFYPGVRDTGEDIVRQALIYLDEFVADLAD